MTDDLKPYDPRPEWMRQYHKEVEGGADRFREWARQNLSIDIDVQLQYDQGTGKAGIAGQVLEAVAKQIPFILHNGPKRFCVIIPKLQIITIYASGGNTTEILNAKQFQNRVKMLYVIYPPIRIRYVKTGSNYSGISYTTIKRQPAKTPTLNALGYKYPIKAQKIGYKDYL